MRVFLKAISYIFHPILTPLVGTFIYFLVTPKYSPLALQTGNLLPIFILTIIVPIIFFLILKNLGVLSSSILPTIKERIYSLSIIICLLLMVVLKVISNNYIEELHFYFVGLIAASLTALTLLFLKLKISLHLMSLGSVLIFIIALSVHFEKNITLAISIATLITGAVASSRLYLKSHTKIEVVVGLVVGCVSQLLLLKFWL